MSDKLKIQLISVSLLGVAGLLFIPFLAFHEKRANELAWEIADPIAELLPASDVSLPIFSITYGAILLYLISAFRKEYFIPRLMLSYAIILLLRMLTLTILPLKAPDSYVYLQDPFLNNLIYPGHIRNDLFFSGHTALVFAIFLLSGRKWIFLLLTIFTGILVMVQRVHYSFDVLAAIPFAWLSTYLAGRIITAIDKTNNT